METSKAQYSPSVNLTLTLMLNYLLSPSVGGSSEYGGGINNFGKLTLFDIAITGNIASNSGGGIFNHGNMTGTTVKISDSSAGLGAGIFNDVGSVLILNNVHIQLI